MIIEDIVLEHKDKCYLMMIDNGEGSEVAKIIRKFADNYLARKEGK